MRVVFLGSPPFAIPILERLASSRHRPLLVVTPPDRPQGRGRRVRPSEVAAIAEREGIECLRPESTRDPALHARLHELAADVFLVASYGELLREDFLAIPKLECLNVHPSLLPRHRGATPVQAAILAGDEETGVSIQRVVMELDAGDVLVQTRTRVEPGETAGELALRLAELAAATSVEALDLLVDGNATWTPQDPERVTVCRKLKKEHGRVDWTRGAAELERHVRGMNPWPTAQTTLADGAELQLLRARVAEGGGGGPGTLLAAAKRFVVAAGDGALELVEVKSAGKRAMSGEEFLRGARLEPGSKLGS